MTDVDALWADWERRLKHIDDELVETFALRRQYRDFAKLFEGNQQLREQGGHVWSWLRTCYVNTMMVRVRRHTDGQANEAGLRRLILSIAERPEAVTRARIVERAASRQAFLRGVADEYFTREWTGGDPTVENPSPSALQRDADGLRDTGERLVRLANTRYIHHQPLAGVVSVPFAEIDEVLDEIERVFQRYFALVDGGGLTGLEPVPQFNTHAVFTFPWITPSTSPSNAGGS